MTTLYKPLDYTSVSDALAVAASQKDVELTDSDHKMVGFLILDGECDVSLKAPSILVRYSWRMGYKPSRYFGRLFPGTLKRLMKLGRIERIDEKAKFEIGPGTTGPGRYERQFSKKWISIRSGKDEINIRVRAKEADLEVLLAGDTLDVWREKFSESDKRLALRESLRGD